MWTLSRIQWKVTAIFQGNDCEKSIGIIHLLISMSISNIELHITEDRARDKANRHCGRPQMALFIKR